MRQGIVKFFATPGTVTRYAAAAGLTYQTAREHVLDWFDGTNLFDAGRTEVDPIYPGRPAHLYCSNEALANESRNRPAPEALPAKMTPDFFAAPRTLEEFSITSRIPLRVVKILIESSGSHEGKPLYFAGECPPVGVSKKGTPYPRGTTALYCTDRSLAIEMMLRWAAKRWSEYGCPEE